MPVERVLMTADAVGGVWTYALDLSRALGARGIRVTLAVMGPPPGEAARRDAREADVDLHERPCALEWMDDPWDDVEAAGRWLRDLERRVEPQVVHLNGYTHAVLPWRSPVIVAGHSCLLSWWQAVHAGDPPVHWREYAARVTAGLQAADLVVAPSRAMLQALQFHYGPLARTAVIANGRRTAVVAGASKEPFILTAGRLWDPAKNAETLCAAARDLAWPVYVAGPGGGGDAATTPGVTALGALTSPALAAWMARASIYALPARYEPFGLSALEAAQAGCALVLGDISSLREIWRGAALYVPPDNRRALAVTLQSLIGNAAFRGEMAWRARERARSLTPERMADGYVEAYRQVAAAREAGRHAHRDLLPLAAV